MSKIPQDKLLDNTLSILQEGYQYITNRRKKFDSDIFKARFMGKPAVCISGEEGAKIFYSDKMQRKGALPKRIKTTLMGKKGVHTLDSQHHHHRKAMFMQMMGRESLERLITITEAQWDIHVRKWEKSSSLILFNEVQEILTRIICEWSGVPLNEWEVKLRSSDLAQMVDSFGGVGIRHHQGKQARKRSEEWISDIVDQTRRGILEPSKDTVLYRFSHFQDLNEEPLPLKVATVEVLNILRPTVALVYFVLFGALAMHNYPDIRRKLKEGNPEYLEWFVQEVRRFYPFAPFLGAKVKEEFTWKDYTFKPGKLVILDVYGINHDPRIWDDPGTFEPERFRNWNGSPFNFIPQGGGEHQTGHRCAGEWMSIGLLKVAFHYLSSRIEFEVLDQDLSYSLSRMPSKIASGFMIRDVKLVSMEEVNKVETFATDAQPVG
jgi:fatty-acid peroxygenase